MQRVHGICDQAQLLCSALALARAGEEYLRGCGARRVTALVAFDDETAAAFWDSAGYPLDHEIGRRVRNL